jgi:hypothetical protein
VWFMGMADGGPGSGQNEPGAIVLQVASGQAPAWLNLTNQNPVYRLLNYYKVVLVLYGEISGISPPIPGGGWELNNRALGPNFVFVTLHQPHQAVTPPTGTPCPKM